jgi:hypothetical protein
MKLILVLALVLTAAPLAARCWPPFARTTLPALTPVPPAATVADPSALAAGEAVIYLHRGTAFILRYRKTRFFVDGVKVATVGSGGCVILRVAAGDHELAENWLAIPLVEYPMSHMLRVRDRWEAGRAYHYLFETAGGLGHDIVGNTTLEEDWRLAAIAPPPETSDDKHALTNAPCKPPAPSPH